jgi:hypothetical protein
MNDNTEKEAIGVCVIARLYSVNVVKGFYPEKEENNE